MQLFRSNNFLCLMTMLMSCTLIDDLGDPDNPFDPNGTNWIKNQPPVLYDYILSNPPWTSFNFSDSTGSVTLDIYAYDPEGELDTVSYSVLLNENNTDYLPYPFTAGDSTLTVSGIKPTAAYNYKIIAFDTDSLNKNDTAEGVFTAPGGIPPEAPTNVLVNNLSYAVRLQWDCDMTVPITVYRSKDISGPFDTLIVLYDTVHGT